MSFVRQSWIPGRRSIPMFDATACGSGKKLGVTLHLCLSCQCPVFNSPCDMGPSCQCVWQCGNLEVKVAHYMKVRDGLVCPKMHLLRTLQGGKWTGMARKKSEVSQVFLTGFIELVLAILISSYATLVPLDSPLVNRESLNPQLKNQSWLHGITSEGSKFRENTSH